MSHESPRTAPEFIDRLIAGDEAAYEELVRTYGPRMRAVAARYLPRPADAEDAVQESFLNVVHSISGFKRASRIETWLHRIVVNCSLMRLRRRRRKPEVTLEQSALDGGYAVPWRRSASPSPHDVVADEEMERAVRIEIERLPGTQREVLLLRDVGALGLNETAQLLDIGISTVKKRHRRARHALEDALAPRLTQLCG